MRKALTVMKMGRWEADSVFYEHHMHSRRPNDFTDDKVHQYSMLAKTFVTVHIGTRVYKAFKVNFSS